MNELIDAEQENWFDALSKRTNPIFTVPRPGKRHIFGYRLFKIPRTGRSLFGIKRGDNIQSKVPRTGK